MNELIVRYYHGNEPTGQVSYRSEAGLQETDKFPFAFSLSDQERKLIQWYLEEYLTDPNGCA